MILLTGSSGFLGQIIKSVLINHNIISIGRRQADIVVNVINEVPVLPICNIVIHTAGKAHSVPTTDVEKRHFFDVNVTGTANLLKGLEQSGLPQSFIFISSVSVYGLESGEFISEDYPLFAIDPYGKSKIEAEQLVWDWCEKNKVICTILRLPLIAGPNPPGNLKTMINGIKRGHYFNIAGGKARKSMVLAEDVAKIIPVAANVGGIYNLTDGHHPSFSELSQIIAKQLGKSKPLNIPMWIATLMAMTGDLMGAKAPINSNKLIKITSDLTFDDTKAQKLLGWNPTLVLKGFTIKWDNCTI
ncbi:MAG: UDP-galactose-4-epimerase [Mucilaginibacter sp.]|uniref:NAD-dependent epimerase/dehydratase family protein n=1 Tax=Mucilaginibacter sp. TaxID=1882438 RepID=UPI0026068688|nr:NAD-dependent epimerase/dehydratase family protein [Mucilaginibacter sp.]MDB5002313.1 UDP-galactose-4-epimerase [Mucilaginibacter sp.]